LNTTENKEGREEKRLWIAWAGIWLEAAGDGGRVGVGMAKSFFL